VIKNKSDKKFDIARFLTSILMWVTVAAILAFAILWLVPNAANPKKGIIEKPGAVQIITSGYYAFDGTPATGAGPSVENSEKIYKAFTDSIKYSMMYGIMEGRWFDGFTVTTEKIEDDDGEEADAIKEFYKDDFRDITGSKNTPLIAFRYGVTDNDYQTFTYKKTKLNDKTEIKYNVILFTTKDVKFGEYKIYFVDTFKLDLDEDYCIWEFTGYAKLALTWDAIQEPLP